MDLTGTILSYAWRFATRVLPKIVKVGWGTGVLGLMICWIWATFGDTNPSGWFYLVSWLWAIWQSSQLIIRKAKHDPTWSWFEFIRGSTLSRKERQSINPDIPAELQASTPEGFVFGKKGSTFIRKIESVDGHALVIGGVGSGKSSCIAIPSLLSWKERVFAIDIKGELSAKTKHHRPAMKIFDPTDPDTCGYDPFHILADSRNLVQDINEIVMALIPIPVDIKDPFWLQGAQKLLTGALLYFYSQGYSFIDAITAVQSTPAPQLVDEIYKSGDTDATLFVSQFVGLDTKTLAGIFSEVSNNVMLFATDADIKQALSRPDTVGPEDLERGHDVYIAIPENKLEQWKKLLTLIVNQFLKHFERRPDEGAAPVLFLLDEFPRLGKVETVLNGLATLRSKKITVALIIQSMAQLDLTYGKEARQVIADCCNYKAILSATDGDTQEYLSRLVGTYDRSRSTTNANYAPYSGMGTGTGTSLTTEEKRIIKPEDFATLRDIVLLTPFGFARAEKAPYYATKEFS